MLLEELVTPIVGMVYTMHEPRERKGDFHGQEIALLGFRGRENSKQYKVMFLDGGDVDNVDQAGAWRIELVNARKPTKDESEQIAKAIEHIAKLPREEYNGK